MRYATSVLSVVLAAGAVAGCEGMSFPRSDASPPAGSPQRQDAAYLGSSVMDTTSGDADNSTAVESALAWSEKNARLTEELMRVRDQKYQLEESNRKLREQLTGFQEQSAAAQKELNEANQMLIEMRREMDGWKSNVLGFRNEIRTAEKAQMEALRKVLVLLGAEVSQPTTQPAVRATAMTGGPSGETR
ncbi:MAG TPA: hypothetical protein VNA25_26715 [Phycisphaerae bacterium]|nr:hypothetical protein [Phycisphaerae bacterium]